MNHFGDMPTRRWVFRAKVKRVIDGDTVDVDIDQGMHAVRSERIRLLLVDTPELRGARADPKAAIDAKNFTEAWCAAHQGHAESDVWPFIIETQKSDAFGRYLAAIWCPEDGLCLNDAILSSGHGVVWSY